MVHFLLMEIQLKMQDWTFVRSQPACIHGETSLKPNLSTGLTDGAVRTGSEMFGLKISLAPSFQGQELHVIFERIFSGLQPNAPNFQVQINGRKCNETRDRIIDGSESIKLSGYLHLQPSNRT